MKEHRYGKFSISYELIETNPDIVKKVMGQTIIYDACYSQFNMIYVAECDQFREIKEGHIVPEYAVHITNDEIIKFIEVQKYDHICNSIQS